MYLFIMTHGGLTPYHYLSLEYKLHDCHLYNLILKLRCLQEKENLYIYYRDKEKDRGEEREGNCVLISVSPIKYPRYWLITWLFILSKIKIGLQLLNKTKWWKPNLPFYMKQLTKICDAMDLKTLGIRQQRTIILEKKKKEKWEQK